MKRFILKWFIFFVPIFAITGFYRATVSTEHSGDIGTLGHISFGYDYDRITRSLSLTRNIQSLLVDVDSASNYPVLLIGDSFSEPQNSLGHTLSQEFGDTIRVVHDLTLTNKYLPTKILLYGLTHNCFRAGQTIILETIERSLVERFAQLDLNDVTIPSNMRKVHLWREAQEEITSGMEDILANGYPAKTFAINDILTWMRIKMGYNNPIRQYQLVKPMFTHELYADQLFIYKDDFHSCNLTEERLNQIAASANCLAQMAEAQGIHLYLLVIPDKYELYRPYIAQQEGTPQPNALEFINRSEIQIINARDTLAPLLAKDVMDVWRINDSHWSIMTAEYIARKIANRIKADNVLCQDAATSILTENETAHK